MKGMDSEQTKKRAVKPDINVKMRLFVRIDGISPFVLRLVANLHNDHYKEIVEQYYNELYQGRTPGLLYLTKIVNFQGGDKLFVYKRREVALDFDFSIEGQEHLNIYDEPEPCEESIIMQQSPAPELCGSAVPKNIGLNRLILKITDPYCHKYIENVFWWTYRSVISPPLLLKKLIERWYIPSLSESLNYAKSDVIYYETVVKRQVQQHVVRTMYNWVKHYYFDFTDEMVSTLQQFCNTELNIYGYRGLQKELLDLMNTTSREPHWKTAKTEEQLLGVTASTPEASSSILSNLLMTMTEREIADQLTLADFKIYKEIHFTEMIGLAWTKDGKRHMVPNIMNNIEMLNKVANWVTASILKEEDMRTRKKVLRKFIKILSELMDLNSLNMINAVNSGLNSSSIHRLSQTWNEIDEKTMKLRDPIHEITDTNNNCGNFRKAMDYCFKNGLQCSPFIGTFLTHLVFNHDGNPTFIDGKINFLKCMQSYNIMRQVVRFQNRPYHIIPNQEFMSAICGIQQKSESELYSISLRIQPRITK